MATKLIAPEATTASIATTTVYTTPTAKAARIRIAFKCKAGAGNTDLTITIGNLVVIKLRIGNGLWAYTVEELGNPSGFGVIRNNDANDITDLSGANYLQPTHIIAPLAQEFILAAGQVVSYTIATTAANQIAVKVMGVEDDA